MMTITNLGELDQSVRAAAYDLDAALRQLLDEVIDAGFETATDHNWPKAIADARAALAKARGQGGA